MYLSSASLSTGVSSSYDVKALKIMKKLNLFSLNLIIIKTFNPSVKLISLLPENITKPLDLLMPSDGTEMQHLAKMC